MKRILIVTLALLFFTLSRVYCQTINQHNIIADLRSYSINHLIEKTYLHFDKPYYAAGDTMYFKAYVTAGEQHALSGISGILHVDLIGATGKIERSIKLQLNGGTGWGDFALADSLPPGNYRVRAYTRWMRNEGNYFEKVIAMASVHTEKVFEHAVKNAKAETRPDIQFMPEGGSLVYGIASKIAFKALGTNGLGIGVKGIVMDNMNQEVCTFESSHLGMGYFNLKPEQGKSYRARLTYASGGRDMIDLPLPVSSGITLSVNNDSLPKASVTLRANKSYFNLNKGKDYTLLIYSGGLATTVALKLDSARIGLEILKRRMHTGVATLTLFSSTNEPIAERLLFIQNYDQLNLNISADKADYAVRGKVNIQLSARNRADSAVVGHFSVAVTDESKVPSNEHSETTILSSLLLTADLTGTIEQPNYYFTDNKPEKLKELDLVMLTHGYRHFTWKQVFENYNQPVAWQPERSLQISGTARSLFGKPLPNAAVALISFEPRSLSNTTTNDKGQFQFDNLLFSDTINFVLQATTAKGGRYTKLTYRKDEPLTSAIPDFLPHTGIDTIIPLGYLENNDKQQEQLNKSNLGNGRILNEVKIEARKSDDFIANPRYGFHDRLITGNQIGYGGMLSTKLLFLIHRPGYLTKAPLIVIDGVEMPLDFDINMINTGSIKSLEVFFNVMGKDMNGRGYQSVYAFTTNYSSQATDIASTGTLPIKVAGYYKAREFYSPKYEQNAKSNRYDLRSTIYWQPELTTDKAGNATFHYYNADGKGTYRVVVEGIDEKGNLGRQVYRYKVE